jgi:predicted transposase
MQTTIRGKVLQTTHTQDDVLDRLIRQQEAAKRVSFCRICEGKSRTDIVQEDLKPKFSLNTRYLRDAHYEAKATHKSAEELMDDPSKVIFGGRKWFYERQRGKITRRE